MRGGRWKGPVETSEDDQMFQVALLPMPVCLCCDEGEGVSEKRGITKKHPE